MTENNTAQIAAAAELVETFYFKLVRLLEVLDAAAALQRAAGEGAKLPASIMSEAAKLKAETDKLKPEIPKACALLAEANLPIPNLSIH